MLYIDILSTLKGRFIFETSQLINNNIIHEWLDFNTRNNENTVPFGVIFKTFIIITNFFSAFTSSHYENSL